MSEHGLTAENILTAFPIALQGDQDAAALAEVTARLLARRPEEIDRLRIYPNIHRLDEKLLDLLAYDFKVDWWDPDYSLEEKRRVFKDSWYVHRHMGTKAAVETAIRAIYPKASVLEWFNYGGKPYYFKLNIDLTGEISDMTRPWRVLERVNFYKSLRSHVDEIVFTFVMPAAALHVGGGVGAHTQIGVPVEPDTYSFQDTLHVGGSMGEQSWMGVPTGPDGISFHDTVRVGGSFATEQEMGIPEDMRTKPMQYVVHAGGKASGHTSVPVPENDAAPPSTTILRTGGVCTIISNLSKGG